MDSIHPGIAVNAVSSSPSKATANATPSAATSPATATSPARTDAVKALPDAKEAAAVQRDPRSLQYQVDGDRVVTTIIDENNKTVVVQIPDAEVIRIAKAIDRMQGFLLHQKA